ncbi:hypothetical protein [Arenimonas daejeonensis]|uniref:hypothetical protein n=1 Tax=Arenimonas daejeonensis TaxID=370777 RepID=UPI0011BEF065|nr:hypothetical protein [Arenimonas daejeonensis]
MNFRESLLVGSLFGIAVAGSWPARASDYDDQAQYVRGYDTCKAGGKSDDSYPAAFNAGCEDALAGKPSKHANLAAQYYPNQDPALETARRACMARHIEGTKYGIEDAEALQTIDAGGGHYHIDVRTPAGSGRCVVSRDGSIFSAKSI